VALTGRVEDWFSLSIFGRITSGFRYTPLVSGDVNGDGYLNDRAFVFDPARVTDSTVARGMAALLSHASPSARSCLEAQLGRIAAHNSCVGPWGISVGTVALDLDSHRIGLGNRGRLTLYFGNPLGGLDQLLHGSNNLHGWGQAAAPDPTLLMVTGFDPTRERFQYAVNDRFGSARATRLMFRPPFRLTIDFRGDVSPNLESQYIELFMRNAAAAAGGSPTRAKLKTYMLRWATRGDLDPILGRADSVQLTAAQRQSLQALGRHLMRFRDSTYSDLADFFVSHRGAYGSASVRRRWHSSIAASVREAFAASRETRALLSEDQRKWLREHRLGSLIDQTTTWLERTLERPFVAPR
jgi:hypothetical protein